VRRGYTRGVPRKEIKVSEIRKLSMLQVTEREAAGFFGVRVKWFKRILKYDARAAQAWEDGRQQGLVGLRRSQMILAHGNAAMAKWLGRQYLGQTDTVIMQHTGADGGPIQTMDLEKLGPKERQDLRNILLKTRVKRDSESSDDE